MKKFDDQFKKLMEEHVPLSDEARKRFDNQYKNIRQEKPINSKPQKRKLPRLILTAAIVLLSLAILSLTPVGQAAANFLQFGQFTSETLKKEKFVTKQKSHSVNEQTNVSLAEFYVDQQQIGIHFKIKIPKNSQLLEKGFDDYSLKFSIENADGTVLFNNGPVEKEKNQATIFSAATEKAHFDSQTNTLELTYTLKSSELNIIPRLNNATVKVSKISAIKNPKITKPGFYQAKSNDVDGNWVLPIDTSQIKEFPTIQFNVTSADDYGILRAEATPSTLIITFTDSSNLSPKPSDHIITATIDGSNKTYTPSSSNIDEQDHNYYKVLFDYSGYDQTETLLFDLGNGKQVTLTQVDK